MLKDTLLKLLTIPGPSGYEAACADYIEEELKPYADEISRDVMGNLICVKHGRGGKKVMLSAHMDEIGFIVTAIEDAGYLRVSTIGGVRPPSLRQTTSCSSPARTASCFRRRAARACCSLTSAHLPRKRPKRRP